MSISPGGCGAPSRPPACRSSCRGLATPPWACSPGLTTRGAARFGSTHTLTSTRPRRPQAVFAGMSMAVLTGHCYRNYWAQIGDGTPIAEESIVMFGVRDVAPEGERERLERSAIEVVEWRRGRPQGDVLGPLDALAQRVDEIYLHVDFDGFGPDVAPGVVDEPAPGGLSLEDAEAIIGASANAFKSAPPHWQRSRRGATKGRRPCASRYESSICSATTPSPIARRRVWLSGPNPCAIRSSTRSRSPLSGLDEGLRLGRRRSRASGASSIGLWRSNRPWRPSAQRRAPTR